MIAQVASALYSNGISGTRVISGEAKKSVDGYSFQAWGAHSTELGLPYLTAAATVGMTKSDVDVFVKKLSRVLACSSA